ncbi:hypothetical protein PG910_08740 [Tenacibaculum dicentrarchi]|nr:hypothetical protein PG910_08740 [Tenacibaculum dicentrarchi]
MKIFSEDSISVQQFKHFKKSITKALDKKLALNKSFDISEKDFFIKYPFIKELKTTISKTNQKTEQIDLMSVILNNYFNTAWKEKGKNSIKLKRDFEKDIEKIIFLLYPQNDSEEKILQKPVDEISYETTTNKKTNNYKNYTEFLLKIKEFDFYDEKTNSLELTSFKTSDKKALLLNHAYIILLIFWFEEIVKKKTYLDRLSSSYYTEINNLFLEENKISKQNWRYFKKNYLSDLKIKDLKETEFYKELLKFYKKNTVK